LNKQEEEDHMTVLHIEYTQQPDCRVPNSQLIKDTIDVECDGNNNAITYSKFVEVLSEKIGINKDEFDCSVYSQELIDMRWLDVSSYMKTSMSVVLDDGCLHTLSKDFEIPIWESDRNEETELRWWVKNLSCHIRHKYSPDSRINFKVLLASGDVIDMTASPHDTLGSVLRKYSTACLLSGPFDYTVPLDQNMSLIDLGIGESAILSVVNPPEKITFYVSTLTGKRVTFRDVSLLTTIADVKALIQDREGIPPDQQRLVHGGRQLEDELTLLSYGIQNDAVIHLILRLRGGMYHEVSSRFGFDKLKDACPVLNVAVATGDSSSSTLSVRLKDFIAFDHMLHVVTTRASDMKKLLDEKEDLNSQKL
jgi:hypothetical protein